MLPRWFYLSLRWKLILGSALIEVVMLSLLVVNTVRLIETSLQEQVELRLGDLSILLNAAIAPSMAELDYAPIQGVFAESRREQSIVYFALFDKDGKQVAGDGWDLAKPLPTLQQRIDLTGHAQRFDTQIPIGLGDQVYGRLQFGISTEFMHLAREKLLRQSLAISGLEILLSIILLVLLGIWLTHHLRRLELASLAVARGNFDISVEVNSADEIARVGQAFNRMTLEIKQKLLALGHSEARFRSLTELSADWYWEQDAELCFTGFQGGTRELRELLEKNLIGKRRWDGWGFGVTQALWAQHREVLAAHQAFRDFEYEIVSGKNEPLFISASGTPYFDADGCFAGYRGIGKDITGRKQIEIALVRSEKLLRLSQQAAQIGSYVIDLVTGRWEGSALLYGILGIDERFVRDIAGWQSLLHPEDRERVAGDFQTTLVKGRAFSREYRIVRPDNGETRWIVAWGDYECDSANQPVLQVGAMQDITERKAAAGEIEQLAFYDPLTGLPNRRLLLDRLRQAVASSTRSERHGALLFLDLDDFKSLNDTLGHDRGDQLLQQVAQRLSTCVREGDTVARLGGDEFVLMLEDLSENEQEAASRAETVGQKILALLNQAYQLGSYVCHSTPSIGVTLFLNHQGSIEELMKRADLAMYQAKAAGRNTLRFFDPLMQAALSSRTALEADLREAVRVNQFVLYYQAQVNEQAGVTGVEALLRWQHPQRGLVSPIEFIALTEDTGLILPLGRWVLETACNQLALWALRPELAHLTIAVNVSAHQLHHADFVSMVLAVLESSGANPRRLKLELTESLLVRDVEGVIAKMTALKTRGVGFSLDDFGTGYSSLSYLKRLPLDQLKIDQGFVRDILIDPNDAAIANMVVALADSLGLSVIAEGVEFKAQSDYLARHGCHAYQGYYYGRPLPLAAFEASMARA